MYWSSDDLAFPALPKRKGPAAAAPSYAAPLTLLSLGSKRQATQAFSFQLLACLARRALVEAGEARSIKGRRSARDRDRKWGLAGQPIEIHGQRLLDDAHGSIAGRIGAGLDLPCGLGLEGGFNVDLGLALALH